MFIFDVSLSPLIVRAFLASIFISLSVFGSSPFVAMRGLSFLVVEVAHAVLWGATLGILLNVVIGFPIDPILSALLFAILSGLIAGYLGEKGMDIEIAIGSLFALNMALAVFLISIIPPSELPKVWGLLIGDLLMLTQHDLGLLIVSSTIIVFLSVIFHREMTYVSFDIEGAAAHGIRARFYHYLMVLIISIATVVSVKAIGVILVYALMVLPGAISIRLSTSTLKMCIISMVVSLFSLFLGISISILTNIPPSGIVGIALFIIYLIALKKSLR